LARPDYSNFGPRLGFAYSLNDRTVVRGGIGIYYSPILYGFEGGNTIEASLGYRNAATPFDGCPRCRRPDFGSLQARYFLRNLPSSGPLAPVADPNDQFVNQGIAVDYFNKDYRTGRSVQYSLDLQRELPGKFAASIGYIGHRGTRLRSNFERLNAVPLDALKLGFPLLNKQLADVTAAERTYAAAVGTPLPASPNAVYAGFSGSVAQALRPFPQYGRVRSQLESNGQSWYNAVQAKLDRRFAQGIQFGASYTFSKLITDASEDLFGGSPIGELLQNPYDRRQIRTVSPNNPYHVFVFNYIFELPFGKGKRFLNGGGTDRLFGGWQISGIHRYQSGLPLVVRDTEPGRAGFLGLVGFEGALRPNLTGQQIFTGDPETGIGFQLVNRAAFATPPNFQAPPTSDVTNPAYGAYYAQPTRFFGNAPPVLDYARSLPFFSENFSVLKKTRLTETTTIELRAEFFNLFNRHRYFGPDNDLRSGGFGRSGVVNSNEVYAPRNVQLGLRFIF